MATHRPILLAMLPLFCAASLAQVPDPQAKAPAPIPMPSWRAAHSYQIYSQLMLARASSRAPDEFWLIQDATVTAVRPNEPCHTDPKVSDKYSINMNPHVAVHPPQYYEQDFREILADFDAHCHETVTLDASLFDTPIPVRLLNSTQQDQFRATHYPAPGTMTPELASAAAQFRGATALYAFSEVYFNAHQTVALVYATHWCGMLCGGGGWVAFALEDGNWKRLNWSATGWVS